RQGEGDSFRRQSSWHEKVAQQEGWRLDYSLKLVDRGRSAFTGEHLKHDLGRFLQAINDDVVKPGSVLLVEEHDRLTRLPLYDAITLVGGILRSGVEIRTSRQHFRPGDEDRLEKMLNITVDSHQTHEESRKKSERVGDNWKHWRARAARGEKVPPPGKLP